MFYIIHGRKVYCSIWNRRNHAFKQLNQEMQINDNLGTTDQLKLELTSHSSVIILYHFEGCHFTITLVLTNISVHVYYILNTTGTSFIVHVYISYPYLFSIILNITCIILQEVGWTFFIKQMPVINSLDIRIKQGNISLVNLKSLQSI